MLKLAGPSEPATTPIDNEPVADDDNFDNKPVADDKPFDDEPFDAGVEASEDSDPKKYIEQLTGKLGQSLRKYTEEQGQPDFDLEKFAINSLLSATHTSEMDEEDKKDIIQKVNTAGNDNEDDSQDMENDMDSNSDDINSDDSNDVSFDEDPMGQDDEEGLNETKTQVELDNPNLYPDGWKEMDGIFMNPKKNNMFQPNSNDILKNDLNVSENISIFGKDKILSKLQETFNQDETMNEPMVEPEVKPDVKPTPVKEPSIAPSRKNKPFLPMPEVTPDPKAIK